ncbi:hypothetical protein M3484_16750 [Pseudomonas sp. GX19020]|uniref:hypothetical protein n=1 Tax=Pseudomonas sp. GX19020 TaxID=2942277 RepID=UPI00201A1BA7|nr:hypothetical protein [Pseudomonas sp. GX19020]MCL4068222.1 hypothetical protein [Pseudomonas sp. GX19020]
MPLDKSTPQMPDTTDEDRRRVLLAADPREAIGRCDPGDADLIMSDALAKMRAGRPVPPLMNAMDEARNWAAMASLFEIKAYALACYNAMPPKDQAAFLVYVSGRDTRGR